jgi:hypothetical protein
MPLWERCSTFGMTYFFAALQKPCLSVITRSISISSTKRRLKGTQRHSHMARALIASGERSRL